MTSKSRMLAAVAGALSMGAVASYAADAQSDARIQELEAKVAALQASQASSSKDVAATIDSVLRDAERRSQLLQNSSNMGAGYDNGFFISGGEGWTLRPGAHFQFRNVTNWADDRKHGGEDEEIENGFEIRRMRLELNGTAFTRDLEYNFVWESDQEGSTALLDAWVKYMFADDFGFRAGQFKALTTHEKLVSSKRQLAADRSMLDTLIGGGFYDRVQGMSLIYGGHNPNNPLAAEVAFHDGPNTKNTDFTKSAVNAPNTSDDGSDWGVGGRVEYKAMGDWRDHRDFSAMNNKEDLLVLGAAMDWSQFGDGDLIFGTVDAQWENTGGLSVYGAALISHKTEDFGGATDDTTDWGLLGQIGYMLNPAWEIFGRVSWTDFDAELAFSDSSEDSFFDFTVGVNYFLGNNGSAGHRAKVTIDLTYLPDGSPADITGLGYLANDGNDEIVIRGQFQLLI